MRRISILLSCFFIAIFLIACGNQGSSQSSDDAIKDSSSSQAEGSSSEAESNKNEAPSSQEASSQEASSLNNESKSSSSQEQASSQEENVKTIQVTVKNKDFTATLSDNTGAAAFVELLRNEPLVINMSDYSGFEKIGSLGTNLPTDNSSITATQGDIILYNGNQICVFYGSNSWSYTILAKIDNLSGWREALGNDNVTVTFSLS